MTGELIRGPWPVPTPTLDRMQAPHVGGWTRKEGEPCRLVDHSQLIGQFVDWLEGQGIHLARWTPMTDEEKELLGDEVLLYAQEPREKLLARYFDIDLNAVETEKRALLEAIQNR